MKEKYESPVVDILEVEVEKGFSASLPGVNDGGSATDLYDDWDFTR